jgi:hypothetical protein
LLLDKTDTETEARVTNPREKSVAPSNKGSPHGQLTQCNIQAILSIEATHLAIESFETIEKTELTGRYQAEKFRGYKICFKWKIILASIQSYELSSFSFSASS